MGESADPGLLRQWWHQSDDYQWRIDFLRSRGLLTPLRYVIAGIGAVMNVMTNRLIWVANKIERILNAGEEGDVEAMRAELPALELRRIFAQRAVMLSTASALTISVVIVLLFISAFVTTPLGTLVAVMWVISMGFLVAGLGSFLMETRTAAKRNRERMRERRARSTA